MRDRIRLDWRVPEAEWERFREHVESEFGSLGGYLGREAELAMKEYADEDGYDGVEEKVDRLVRAAGRTPSDLCKEKISSPDVSTLADQPSTRVTVRVDERMKEKFVAVADQSDVENYGLAFARAIQQYREGGRAARLEEKLDRIVDDAEAVLSELQPEESRETSLSTVQRRTIIICNRLPEQFTEDELQAEIADVAGESEPTIEKYRERVIDRLNYEPHPEAPKTVWVPAEVAAEYAPDGVPPEIRRPVDVLDREERVRRIQIAVGASATAKGGRRRASAADIHEQVFDNEISLSSVLDLLNQAALTDGFKLDRSGENASFMANVAGGLTDGDLADAIRDYCESGAEDLLGPTETKVQDWTQQPGPPDSPDVQSSGSSSGAATDGGGPGRKDGGSDE